jgi:hypothetical protein
MKPTANTLFIILTAVIVAAAAYWYFLSDAPTEAFVTGGVVQSPTQLEFQMLVTQLQPVSFDTGVFSDPEFQALQDLTTPVAPEDTGRADPFAPVSGVSAQP